MKLSKLPKHERVTELLRLLGNDVITVEQFWNRMREHGYTDEDIDRLCTGARL